MRYGKRQRKRQRKGQGQTEPSAAPAGSAGSAGSSEAAEASPGRVTSEPWWERWEGRLEYELERLEALGVDCELDKEAFEQGAVVVRVKAKIEEEEISLVAHYPDFYPYTRFEVAAPELDLLHHQAPFKKNLCLIGQSTENWKPSDTLADFIKDRLPIVLQTARSEQTEEVSGLEEHQGEPFSVYYLYNKDSTVLVDGDWSLDLAVTKGELIIGVKREAGEILRGAVLEVKGADGRVLAAFDPTIRKLYPKNLSARWVRINEPIREVDPREFHKKLVALYPSLSKPRWQLVRRGHMDVIGLVFPEETAWREKTDSWLFLIRHQSPTDRGYGTEMGVGFARAARVGHGDLKARIPELSSLAEKRIAVFGAGGVGWASALELARNGAGELRVLDDDTVEGGTIVRWAFGLPAVGVQKVDAIAEFIGSNYPYTKVIPYVHRIGGILNDGRQDIEVLEEILDQADLVYDATAEPGIQRLLSDLAAEKGLPYIGISTTQGAWGGMVARVRPDKTSGCWMCLQHALTDESIAPPAADPGAVVQPAGCASPTFTGASFDIEEVSLMGVRLAVSTLMEGVEGAYPEAGWDVGVVNLREGKSELLAPQWKTYVLDRHPLCSCATKTV